MPSHVTSLIHVVVIHSHRPPGGWLAQQARDLMPWTAALLDEVNTTAVASDWLREWRFNSSGSPAFREMALEKEANATLPQRIPRRIWQTVGSSATVAIERTPHLSRWWLLNPEYDYHLLSERDCTSFVHAVAPPWWRWVYGMRAPSHTAQRNAASCKRCYMIPKL
jgi:mannosyltransferase OCH1-like enzyme